MLNVDDNKWYEAVKFFWQSLFLFFLKKKIFGLYKNIIDYLILYHYSFCSIYDILNYLKKSTSV